MPVCPVKIRIADIREKLLGIASINRIRNSLYGRKQITLVRGRWRPSAVGHRLSAISYYDSFFGSAQAGTIECVSQALSRPSGAGLSPTCYPQLAPWAIFLGCSAAMSRRRFHFSRRFGVATQTRSPDVVLSAVVDMLIP